MTSRISFFIPEAYRSRRRPHTAATSGRARIGFDPQRVAVSAIMRNLARLGYRFVTPTPASHARVLKRLPDKTAYKIVRWKNILMQIATYELARRRPGAHRLPAARERGQHGQSARAGRPRGTRPGAPGATTGCWGRRR